MEKDEATLIVLDMVKQILPQISATKSAHRKLDEAIMVLNAYLDQAKKAPIAKPEQPKQPEASA